MAHDPLINTLSLCNRLDFNQQAGGRCHLLPSTANRVEAPTPKRCLLCRAVLALVKIYCMPYCDNIHSISLDKDLCGLGKSRIIHDLSGMGFSIHEEEEASTWFNTLGGVVDGQSSEVRMSNTCAASIKSFDGHRI